MERWGSHGSWLPRAGGMIAPPPGSASAFPHTLHALSLNKYRPMWEGHWLEGAALCSHSSWSGLLFLQVSPSSKNILSSSTLSLSIPSHLNVSLWQLKEEERGVTEPLASNWAFLIEVFKRPARWPKREWLPHPVILLFNAHLRPS